MTSLINQFIDNVKLSTSEIELYENAKYKSSSCNHSIIRDQHEYSFLKKLLLSYLYLPLDDKCTYISTASNARSLILSIFKKNVKSNTLIITSAHEHNSVILPDSIEEIGEDAFSRCLNIRSIRLPSSIAILRDNVFFSCVNLNSVVLPDKLNTIGKFTFCACEALQEIHLPSSLQNIHATSFLGCVNLKNIYCSAQQAKWIGPFFKSSPKSKFIINI